MVQSFESLVTLNVNFAFLIGPLRIRAIELGSDNRQSVAGLDRLKSEIVQSSQSNLLDFG
jgi:hypothetical protein